jgi:hypothetical protein
MIPLLRQSEVKLGFTGRGLVGRPRRACLKHESTARSEILFLPCLFDAELVGLPLSSPPENPLCLIFTLPTLTRNTVAPILSGILGDVIDVQSTKQSNLFSCLLNTV